MNAFDLTVFHLVNGMAGHNHILDAIMIFFAKDALEIYAVLFLAGWFVLPKENIEGRHALVMAGLAGILALIINVIIAHFYYRARPFVVLPKGADTQLIPHVNDSSFPSDHASGSFAFAGGSWNRAPKTFQILFTCIAIIVMFARVYVGVHWPTDVLASVVVGVFSGRIIWLLSKWVRPITVMVARWFRFGPQSDKNKSMNA